MIRYGKRFGMAMGSLTNGASSSKEGRAPASQLRTYLATLPAKLRRQVLTLHDAIRSAAPEATESFGYGMPAFKLAGKNFVWYGAWKNHISFYPLSDETRRALADDLAAYDTSGKGTIRFRPDEDLPTSLVIQLVRARIAELRIKAKIPH